jgi:hypothetical protein
MQGAVGVPLVCPEPAPPGVGVGGISSVGHPTGWASSTRAVNAAAKRVVAASGSLTGDGMFRGWQLS